MSPLAGRRVLVTGGGSGIGRAIAELCAASGAQVAIMGRTRTRLDAVASSLEGAHAIIGDVTDEAQVGHAVAQAAAAMGGLDGLVNCAGFASMTRLGDTSLAEWQAQLAIHMTATFLMCRAAAPVMADQPAAAIVNIASVAGLRPGLSGAAYAAAKAGQIHFSKALALELAPAVRVNALCAGPTATELSTPNFEAMRAAGTYNDFIRLFPLGRVAAAEEIARVAVFLLSDHASFVTGAAWPVDAGRSLH